MSKKVIQSGIDVLFLSLLPLSTIDAQKGGTPQLLHDILVPNTQIISFNQALQEFTYYHSINKLTYDNNYIQTNYGITWPNPMLMWEGHYFSVTRPYPRWTGFAVIPYARVYRYLDDDDYYKEQYETKARLGAEFLLCVQSYSEGGGIWGSLHPDGRIEDVFNTSICGIAFLECYKSFGDQLYLDAALSAAD